MEPSSLQVLPDVQYAGGEKRVSTRGLRDEVGEVDEELGVVKLTAVRTAGLACARSVA